MSECACITKERVAGDRWFSRGGGGGGCGAGGGSGVGEDTAGGGATDAGLSGAVSSGVLRNEAGQPASCKVVMMSAKAHRQVADLTRFVEAVQAWVLGCM
jgi:hypothetical protein